MGIETGQARKQRPARQVFAASSCTQICDGNILIVTTTEQNSKNYGTRGKKTGAKKQRQLHYYVGRDFVDGFRILMEGNCEEAEKGKEI